MTKRLSEQQAVAQLQRVKAAYRSHIIKVYEPAALPCKSCPNVGVSDLSARQPTITLLFDAEDHCPSSGG